MIRVAICDDNSMELERAVGCLDNYAKTHECAKLTVVTFSDGNELLRHIHKNGGFDIYLLDIILKRGQLGTELAREIINKGQGGQIIFLTSSMDYAIEAFSINATHYILKPYNKVDFDAALDRAIACINRQFIVKNTSEGVTRILVDSILYTESFGHYQLVHMKDGKVYKVRAKTTELWGELSQFRQYFKPHSGYIVNRDYVKSINAMNIVVGTDIIPLSKNSFTKVKKEYLDYIFNRSEES